MTVKTCRQLWLLLYKNWAVHRSSPFLTIIQITLPLCFGLVLFLMKADDLYSRDGFNRYTFETRHPTVHNAGRLPTCAEAIKEPADDCVPLAIVQNPTALGERLLETVLAANPHVAVDSVKRFNTSVDLNTWVLHHPNALVAAVVLPDDLQLRENPSFVVQYNASKSCAFGAFYCNEPWRDVLVPVQVEVERAFLQLAHANSTASQAVVALGVGTAGFPHPEITGSQRDLSSLIGTQFMVLALMVGFVIKLKRLVEEKEARLKLVMRMIGTTDTAMWLAWGIFFLLDALISVGVFLFTMYVLDYKWMTKNDPLLVVLLVLLGWLATAAWAAAFSAILKSAKTALYVGLGLTYVLDIARDNIPLIFSSALPSTAHLVLQILFPPLLFVKGFEDLRTSGPNGLRWADRFDNAQVCDANCNAICPCYVEQAVPTLILPLSDVLLWLLYDTLILSALAVYLDQIIPAIDGGRAERPLFFLDPAYWSKAAGTRNPASIATDEPDVGGDADVQAEAARVLANVNSHDGMPAADSAYAIVAVNLKKSFGYEGKQNECERAVREERQAARARGESWKPRSLFSHTAVYNVTVGIPKDRLFCLLGHNGAGKTTTFNMLSGVFAPTAGDAFVFGHSVKHQLKAVQSLMGICPQHDVLWPELSAREHLELFAGLSMMAPSLIADKVSEFLHGVDLVSSARKPCKTYSGGMRRRLSVASSLIADPKALYLDEPTTGMDPVNRRGVWDLLERAKAGRTIVLTTHAMEEADALGDSISIMSRGRLCCLGAPLKLKVQHAPYYLVEGTCASAATQAAALDLLRPLAQACEPSGDAGVKAQVAIDKVEQVCAATESEAGQAAGLEVAVSMASLEDVFINLAGEAHEAEKRLEREERERKNKKKLKALKAQLFIGFILIYMLPFYLLAYFGEVKRQKKEATEQRKADELEAEENAKEASMAAAERAARDREVTMPVLPFQRTPFSVQFKTLSKKNWTFQKRLKVTNCCLLFTLVLMIGLLFVAENIVGLIIAGSIITCASDVTDPYVGYMPADSFVTLPNVDALNEIQSSLSTIGRATSEACTNETARAQMLAERAEMQERVVAILEDAGMASRYGQNKSDPSSRYLDNVYNTFRGLASSVLCERLGIAKPSEERYGELRLLSRAFGCNSSLFWDELYPKYAYHREPYAMADAYCVPGPNISWEFDGNLTSLDYAECRGRGDSASSFFMDTCDELPAGLPACPEGDEREGAFNVSTTYACTDAAPARYRAVDSGGSLSELVQAAVVDPNDAPTADALSCLVDTICDTLAPAPTSRFCDGVVDLVMAQHYDALANASTEFASGDASSSFSWYRATCASPAASASAGRRLAQEWAPHATHLDALSRPRPSAASVSTGSMRQTARAAVSAFERFLGGRVAGPGAASLVDHLMSEDPAFSDTEGPAWAVPPVWTARRRALQTGSTPPVRQWQIDYCTALARPACKAEAVIDTCNNALSSMREKKLPFTAPTVGSADRAALGYKSFDVSAITSGGSGCVESGTCVEQLLTAEEASSGVLGNFSVRGRMDALSRQLTFPTLTCLDEAGGCDGSLSAVQDYLYSRWYSSNRSDIDYPVPSDTEILGFWNAQEGAYQGVYTWHDFSLDPRLNEATGEQTLAFNYTLSHNTTHWTDGFGELIGVFIELFGGSGALGYHTDIEVPALIHRMNSALYKQLLAEPSVELSFGWKNHPLPASTYDGVSIMRLLAPYSVPTMFAFCFCAMAYAIVREKAEKMRLVGEMAGLGATPYWIINWVYNYCIFVIQLIIVCVCCYNIMGGFAFFTEHDPVVVLLFYLLYGAAMTSFTCFLTTFFGNALFCVVAVGLLTFFIGPLVGNSTSDNALLSGASDSPKMMGLMLLPNLALSNGVMILVATTGDPAGRNARPLTLGNIAMGSEAPMASVLLMLAVDFVVFTVLFAYLDAVLPVGPGVKQSPFFFLQPRYWCGQGKRWHAPRDTSAFRSTTEPAGTSVELQSLALPAEAREPDDVQGERERVLRSQTGGIRAIGLSKIYPGRKDPAVVNIQFGILPSECFGLLGSNGAGKSTAIHILCGLHAPTTGTMLVGDEGLDLRYDLRKIQSSMGVCSQDNLLYEELTGPEHLRFFAGLRRVAKRDLEKHITFWLQRVGLNSVLDRRKRSKAYSGGMKRRLGVANAFIGNPQLVYLDEPSTGLDPQSRRALWHAVRTAQEGKSIVLTTHALEEAQELCARVAIMGFGQIRTIGTPSALRLRFDEGLKFIISVTAEEHVAAADEFAMSLGPNIQRRDAIQCMRTYEVPRGSVSMSHLFERVQANKERLHIADWGLTHPSLETVFLQVVAQTASSKTDAGGVAA